MENEQAVATREEQDEHDLVKIETKSNGNRKILVMSKREQSIDGGFGGFMSMRKRPRPLEEENLTGFHARATNEDDDEFDSNMKRDVSANRQRLLGVFQNTRKITNSTDSNRYSLGRKESDAMLSLHEMASDDYGPESNKIHWKEWNQPKVQNALFFNPTPNCGSSRQGV